MLESEKQQQPTDLASDRCVCVRLRFPNRIGSSSSFPEYFPVRHDGRLWSVHTYCIYSEAPIKDTLGS